MRFIQTIPSHSRIASYSRQLEGEYNHYIDDSNSTKSYPCKKSSKDRVAYMSCLGTRLVIMMSNVRNCILCTMNIIVEIKSAV